MVIFTLKKFKFFVFMFFFIREFENIFFPRLAEKKLIVLSIDMVSEELKAML